MSSDVLLAVAEHLNARDRMQMSLMSRRHLDLLANWRDVTSILVDDNFVLMAGKKFTHRLEKLNNLIGPGQTMLSRVLLQCPSVHKVCIQKRLTEAEVSALASRSSQLKRLSLAADNFLVYCSPTGHSHPTTAVREMSGVRESVDLSSCDFSKLTTLNILQTIDRLMSPDCQMTIKDAQTLMHPSLKKLRITGMALRAEVLQHILTLKELRKLSLSGCIVDTASAELVADFKTLPHLQSLDLPASLFSVHRPPPKQKIKTAFSLRCLSELHTLSLHVECIDEDSFMQLVDTFFPPNLKLLKLYGSTRKMPTTKSWEKFDKFKIEIHSCNDISIRDYWWSSGQSTLIRHMQWAYPYYSENPAAIEPPVVRIPQAQRTINIRQEMWRVTVPKVTAPVVEMGSTSTARSPLSPSAAMREMNEARIQEELLNPPDLLPNPLLDLFNNILQQVANEENAANAAAAAPVAAANNAPNGVPANGNAPRGGNAPPPPHPQGALAPIQPSAAGRHPAGGAQEPVEVGARPIVEFPHSPDELSMIAQPGTSRDVSVNGGLSNASNASLAPPRADLGVVRRNQSVTRSRRSRRSRSRSRGSRNTRGPARRIIQDNVPEPMAADVVHPSVQASPVVTVAPEAQGPTQGTVPAVPSIDTSSSGASTARSRSRPRSRRGSRSRSRGSRSNGSSDNAINNAPSVEVATTPVIVEMDADGSAHAADFAHVSSNAAAVGVIGTAANASTANSSTSTARDRSRSRSRRSKSRNRRSRSNGPSNNATDNAPSTEVAPPLPPIEVEANAAAAPAANNAETGSNAAAAAAVDDSAANASAPRSRSRSRSKGSKSRRRAPSGPKNNQ